MTNAYDYTFTISSGLEQDEAEFGELAGLLHRYDVEVRAHERGSQHVRRTAPGLLAGRGEFYILRWDLACEREIDVVDACDALDQDVYEYASAVVDCRNGELAEVLQEPAVRRIMFLHVMAVLPAHRGRQVGLATVERLIDATGVDLVVCKPYPLQLRSGDDEDDDDLHGLGAEMTYEAFAPKATVAMRKLRRHWERLGFVPVNPTHMILNANVRRAAVKLQARRPRRPW